MAVELSAKFREAEEAFRQAQTDEERVASIRAMKKELSALELELAEPPISPVLQAAWEAFQRDLPYLLRERPGAWVLYHGDKQLRIATDDRQLYQEADRCGLSRNEIVVYCIEPIPEYYEIGCGAWYLDEGPRK